MIFAHDAGITDTPQVVQCEISPTKKNKDIYALNPQEKVSVLVVDENQVPFRN